MKLRALLIIMCLAISIIPFAIIGALQGFEIATASLGITILVTFVVSLIVSYFISLPIEKLTKDIDEISKGNLDINIEKSEIFEIDKLTDSLNRVMASLKLAIHKVGVKKGEIFEETIKAKEEAEEKYENLLKSMDDWVWEIDENGTCKYCSENIANSLGYTPSQIIGKKIIELIAPEELKNVKNNFNKIAKNKQKNSGKFETKLIHKNGKNVCVLTSFISVFDKNNNFRGFIGVVKDNTKLKIAEEKIEELNNKLSDMKERIRGIHSEKILKNKPSKEITPNLVTEAEFDAVFIFDENANIVDCNNNLCGKLGYEKEEILALKLTDLDYLENKTDIKNKINKIKELGKTRLKTIHKKKNGSSLLVNEDIQYLKDKNLFRCVVKED